MASDRPPPISIPVRNNLPKTLIGVQHLSVKSTRLESNRIEPHRCRGTHWQSPALVYPHLHTIPYHTIPFHSFYFYQNARYLYLLVLSQLSRSTHTSSVGRSRRVFRHKSWDVEFPFTALRVRSNRKEEYYQMGDSVVLKCGGEVFRGKMDMDWADWN